MYAVDICNIMMIKLSVFFCRSNFNHGMWQLSSMECDDTFCTNHPLNMTTLALPWTSQ